jgi:hypothetical protein
MEKYNEIEAEEKNGTLLHFKTLLFLLKALDCPCFSQELKCDLTATFPCTGMAAGKNTQVYQGSCNTLINL